MDLVLSGHDHSYQRSKEIATGDGCGEVVVDDFDPDCVADSADTVRAGAGTVFVVAAAGGAELYDVHQDDPEAEYFAAAMGRNTPGALRLRAVGRHAGANRGSLRRFHARLLRGRVRDRAQGVGLTQAFANSEIAISNSTVSLTPRIVSSRSTS